MRFLIILFLVIGTSINSAKACDVCGCALNTSGGEVIPGLFNHYFGVRSNIRSFGSEHLTLFEDEKPILSKEWFHTTELHGMYTPTRRVQLFGFLPFNAVIKEEDNKQQTSSGLGDFRIRANYLWVDKKDADTMLTIFSGITLKTPTGRSKFRNDEASFFHRNMLPGTGTFDVGFHTDIIYAKGKWGGMLNATYLARGRNGFYNFGNATMAQLTAFLKQPLKRSSLLIEAGMVFADLQPDIDMRFNEKQIYSQGWMLAPQLRVSYFKGKWAGVISCNKAAIQEMALGQVHQNYQVDLNIIRFF